MTSEVERVRDAVAPALSAHHLELYDVEVHRSMVRVIVDGPVDRSGVRSGDRSGDRPDRVDLDDLADVTRAVSRALDEADPIAHRYTLEVTSPGIERPLRTPDHFARAVGKTVKVKTAVDVDGKRRMQGVLTAADETGITLRIDDATGGASDEAAATDPADAGEKTRRVAYGDIARARTVFDWAAQAPAPSRPSRRKQKRERRS